MCVGDEQGRGEPLTSVRSESITAESEARRTTLVTVTVGKTWKANVTEMPSAVVVGEIDCSDSCDSVKGIPSIPTLKSVAGPADATRCLNSSRNSPNCIVEPC